MGGGGAPGGGGADGEYAEWRGGWLRGGTIVTDSKRIVTVGSNGWGVWGVVVVDRIKVSSYRLSCIVSKPRIGGSFYVFLN